MAKDREDKRRASKGQWHGVAWHSIYTVRCMERKMELVDAWSWKDCLYDLAEQGALDCMWRDVIIPIMFNTPVKEM